MTGIQVHPDRGVNPRVTVCEACGEDLGVALLGINDWQWKCSCGVVNLGHQRCPPRECQACGGGKPWESVGLLPDTAKLPMGLCDACADREVECAAEVARGGIRWLCEDCGSAGAIKAGHPLARDVRSQMGIEAPNPCGVKFTKDDCPLCTENEDEMTTPGTPGRRVNAEDKRHQSEVRELLQYARKRWALDVESGAFDYVSETLGDVYMLKLTDGQSVIAWFDANGSAKHGHPYRESV